MQIIFEPYFFLVLIAFFIRTLRNAFYQTFLWQLKEYRYDRFWVHLLTEQGKRLILGKVVVVKWILLIFIIGIDYLGPLGLFAYYLFELIWIIEAVVNLRELTSKGWKIPVFTPKIIGVLSITLISQFIPLLRLDPIGQLMTGPFLDKLLAPSIGILILVFNMPSSIYKKIMIYQAKKKLINLKNLIVIGITGSYGKTSTKEFLATVLSEKYKVAKTPASINIHIGIAKYIINELKKDDEILIVEMGAYKKGEIKTICDIVHPKIGLVTGINEQHVELFGSIDKTKQAKYELIESLPDNSHAIFNGDNKYCIEMSQWAKNRKLKILLYQMSKNIQGIKIDKKHIEFTYLFRGNKYNFKVNLLGKQNIENILGAISIAQILEMDIDTIKRGVSKIVSPEKTMKLIKDSPEWNFVDDSYNANPKGVEAAIEYMKLYKGKKVLVLTPLIELGGKSEEIHQKLGRKAASVCDLILLTNPNFEKSFRIGAGNLEDKVSKIRIVKISQAVDIIEKISDKEGIILFEGKEAGRVLDKIRMNKFNYV